MSKPNLVQETGIDYFNEKFRGSFFTKDDLVYKVIMAPNTKSVVVRNIESDEDISLPSDHFMGFKTFEYPLLGYRRFSGNIVGYCSKRQTTQRGFRPELIQVMWSACTRALLDLGAMRGQRVNEVDKALSLFKPKFDSMKDVQKLLNGEETALVLNHNTIIEPATNNENSWYSVIYKQAVVGHMNSKGGFTWINPIFSTLLSQTP